MLCKDAWLIAAHHMDINTLSRVHAQQGGTSLDVVSCDLAPYVERKKEMYYAIWPVKGIQLVRDDLPWKHHLYIYKYYKYMYSMYKVERYIPSIGKPGI